MEAHQYFGLSGMPFEGRPDPRFFFPASGPAEGLATLHYACHARKACCAVLGESGAGKTLLARLLAERVNAYARVLWVHGLGQPDEYTELVPYPPNYLLGPAAERAEPPRTSLARWARLRHARTTPTLLIIDNADGLRKRNWHELIALITREFRAQRALTVILFGLPELLDRLSTPQFSRLRRRVFRICRLARFTPQETAAYVRHRLKASGATRELFTTDALAAIARHSAGNPALINQICDSALLDAFGDERLTIEAPHIERTIHAIVGGLPNARPQLSSHDVQRANLGLWESSAPPVAPRRAYDELPMATPPTDECAVEPLFEVAAFADEPPIAEPLIQAQMAASAAACEALPEAMIAADRHLARLQTTRQVVARVKTELQFMGEVQQLRPFAASIERQEPPRTTLLTAVQPASASLANHETNPLTPPLSDPAHPLMTRLRGIEARLKKVVSEARGLETRLMDAIDEP